MSLFLLLLENMEKTIGRESDEYDVSFVQPQLYISDLLAASNHDVLEHYNITCVISVLSRKEEPPSKNRKRGVHYTLFTTFDSPEEKISKYFAECFKVMNRAVKQKKNVLVHCYAGISRSATMVIMYLMQSNRWSFNQSFKHLRCRRYWVQPNHGFEMQLKTLESRLAKQYSFTNKRKYRKQIIHVLMTHLKEFRICSLVINLFL